MPVPTVGWLAYFADPDGNIHGVWQEEQFGQMIYSLIQKK